jgi:predicted Holliday junction resolvase-like endonuclease
MKLPFAIAVTATISFVAFGVVSLLLAFQVRDLRINVAAQEQQVHETEARIAELMQSLQASDERKEAQDEANDLVRKKVIQQQTAIQRQQEQINRGTQLAQQVEPNLIHDLAGASVKNEKLKGLLIKHGYNVQTK